MQRFAIVGVGGFVAPRHLAAVRETGHRVVAALDPHDAVGILDRTFPEAHFFTEFERFDRHVDKLRRKGPGHAVDYVSICSPNYLHDAHIRFALRSGAHAICEKPLVLNPWNVDALAEFEAESEKRVHAVLQLRLHPAIAALERQVRAGPADRVHEVDLTCVTSRGRWYQASWKGDRSKSGGVATNIGIHFFDMLLWVFGQVVDSTVHLAGDTRTAGLLTLQRARVRWFLSLEQGDLPRRAVEAGRTTWRAMEVDGADVEFSDGFADLHTQAYREILAGRGFGLGDARPSIELAGRIRDARPVGLVGERHRLLVEEHFR